MWYVVRSNAYRNHRRYEIVLADTTLSTGALLRRMQRHLCELVQSSLAYFERSRDKECHDEHDIHDAGALEWSGARN